MQQKESSETSAQIKHRVNITQQRQLDRQAKLNAALGTKEIEQYCALNKTAETLLHNAMEKFALSARVYHRLLKVSRTIADISGSENIEVAHISEALSYRFFDRQGV